jgi:hypothetical protein
MDGYEAVTRIATDGDPEWLPIIRSCYEWTLEQAQKGGSLPFTRETIRYRLGASVPPLTPLVRWQVLARAYTNARGRPYYELLDLDGVGRALRDFAEPS